MLPQFGARNALGSHFFGADIPEQTALARET
jgi:hypothetical protein